jgi:hypothetical protein
LGGELAPARREVGGDDRAGILQTQRGDDGETDRTAPDHERHVVTVETRFLDRVQADRHRLGERSVLGR